MTLVVSEPGAAFREASRRFAMSFTLHPGECVALIGPNGANRSTTFACIAGLPLLAGVGCMERRADRHVGCSRAHAPRRGAHSFRWRKSSKRSRCYKICSY